MFLSKLVLSGLGLIGLVAVNIAGQSLDLILASIHSRGYPSVLADEKFAGLVAKYSNGQMKIQVRSGGSLSTEEKVIIQQIKTGTIALARVSAGTLGAFSPSLSVFGLPYLFDSDEHLWKFLNGSYGQKMLADLDANGFKGLTWYESGARSFYSKKQINTMADLKGQKMRLIPNPILLKTAEALAVVPINLVADRVLAAIQTGVVDGAENNTPSLISFNHYQFVNTYILDEHVRLPEILIINNAIWKKFSVSQRAVLIRAAAESTIFQRKTWAAYEPQALARIKAAGVTVVDVPDKSAWKTAVKPVFEAESKNYPETIQAIEAARSKK